MLQYCSEWSKLLTKLLEGPGDFLLNSNIWRKLGHRHICVRFGPKYERGRWDGRMARTELDRFYGPRGPVDANTVAIFWTGNTGDHRSADVGVEHLSPFPPKQKGGKGVVLTGERMGELVTILKYQRSKKRAVVQVDGEEVPWEDNESIFCAVVDPLHSHQITGRAVSKLAPSFPGRSIRDIVDPLVSPTASLQLPNTISQHTLSPALPTLNARSVDQQSMLIPSYVNSNEKDTGHVAFVNVDQCGENTVSIPVENWHQNKTIPVLPVLDKAPTVRKEWWETWEEEEEQCSFTDETYKFLLVVKQQ
jgi:hypothetical protein